MGTFAASLHLPGADPGRVRDVVREFGRDHELELGVATVDGVVSIHCEDGGFSLVATELARELSSRLRHRVLCVTSFDDGELTCTLYAAGAPVASVTSREKRRPRLVLAAWRRAGLPAPLLARLRERGEDVGSQARLLAEWLRVPAWTLLLNDLALLDAQGTAPAPRRKTPRRKPRISATLSREWAALLEEGRAAGVQLPTLEEHLELVGRSEAPPDEDEVRGMMLLLRLHLPGRGRERG